MDSKLAEDLRRILAEYDSRVEKQDSWEREREKWRKEEAFFPMRILSIDGHPLCYLQEISGDYLYGEARGGGIAQMIQRRVFGKWWDFSSWESTSLDGFLEKPDVVKLHLDPEVLAPWLEEAVTWVTSQN